MGPVRRHRIVPAALLSLAALFASACSDSSSTQAWEFTLVRPEGNTTATATCLDDGSCHATGWTVGPDCSTRISFDASFVGAHVTLRGFAVEGGTASCGSALRPDSGGDGLADEAYPNARAADGQVVLGYIGVLYLPGQPAPQPWHARRVD